MSAWVVLCKLYQGEYQKWEAQGVFPDLRAAQRHVETLYPTVVWSREGEDVIGFCEDNLSFVLSNVTVYGKIA